MRKILGVVLLLCLVCAVSSARAQTYFGVLTSPANSGPGGSCCSTVSTVDANDAAVPNDNSCVGCSVITPAQYNAYHNATDVRGKTRAAVAAKATSGITLTCSATPSLSGTYTVDNTMMTELLVMNGVTPGNSFPPDFTSITVRDTSGGLHVFPTGKAFADFYKIVAWYWVQLLDAQQRILAGQSVPFPAATSSAC